MPRRADLTARLKTAIMGWLRRKKLDHDVGFYTAEQWAARGEEYGQGSVATITTGPDLHGVVNHYYEDSFELEEQFKAKLETLGLYPELGYAWSVHLYPLPPEPGPLTERAELLERTLPHDTPSDLLVVADAWEEAGAPWRAEQRRKEAAAMMPAAPTRRRGKIRS